MLVKLKTCCGANNVRAHCKPLLVNGEEVEQVFFYIYIYLGTDIDSQFSFDKHSDNVLKKAYQRLGLLRKLRSFNIEKDFLIVVYKSLIVLNLFLLLILCPGLTLFLLKAKTDF